MFRLVDRDLADAQVPGLSSDRRFLIVYEAALTLATIPLYAAGYETHGSGHHWATFQVLSDAMGGEYCDLAVYFDSCRTKRNVGSYDRSGRISETEAKELSQETIKFKEMVRSWLRINYPGLVAR
jgi:hypothetical protein